MKKMFIFGIVFLLFITCVSANYEPYQYYKENHIENNKCDFLKLMIVTLEGINNSYEVLCQDEFIGLCFYKENAIIVGDIDKTDLNVLVMTVLHEYGHLRYDFDEDSALRYGLAMQKLYQRHIDLYGLLKNKNG